MIPWLCNSLMELSSASQALVSMKFTESASTSTCLAAGLLAASAAVQLCAKVTNTGKEQVAASAPNQQPGEGQRLGVPPDVAICFRARQLAEHRALRVACSIDQHQQRQHDAERDALQHAER